MGRFRPDLSVATKFFDNIDTSPVRDQKPEKRKYRETNS
jgi:hypothetical protein